MSEKLFILGHPVAHSKSPAMYTAVYNRLGLDWHYDFMDCATTDEVERFLASRDFLSINITTPYKPEAAAAADEVSSSVKLAGGANVLVKQTDATLTAYNVDGIGCVRYFERAGVRLDGARVVVCGTGPTARSIMAALLEAGAGKLTLLGRDEVRTCRVLDDFVATASSLSTLLSNAVLEAATYESARGRAAIEAADIIVDATTLGMQTGDSAPFDTTLLQSGQTVFDVVYGHGETALLRAAHALGCAALNGAGMLVGQAVATVRIVCGAAHVTCSLSSGELFDIMARAAGFANLVDC